MRRVVLAVTLAVGLATVLSGQDYYRSSASLASGTVAAGPVLFTDGTNLLPSIAFATQTNTGLYHAGASDVSVASNGARVAAWVGPDMYLLNANPTIRMGSGAADTILKSAAAGMLSINNTGLAIGSVIKVDGLPTISSGFGTSPSINANSTPFAGSVNVGTGGVASTGLINFNGTAFPSAPFIVLTSTGAGGVHLGGISSTQFNIISNGAAFASGEIVHWFVAGGK